MWIFLSLLAAFGQAFAWALKKRALTIEGVNNSIAAFSFLVAGILLSLVFLFSNESLPALDASLWWATLWIVLANIVAVWAAYRALDKAAFSRLMPFVSVTALLIIPLEYLFRGTVPTLLQIVGMAVVVLGTFFFSQKTHPGKTNWVVVGYFSLTLLAYSLASTLMGVAVTASGSGLFTAAVLHIGIALGFLPLLLVTKEVSKLKALHLNGELNKLFPLLLLTGSVIAFLENGPATLALENASASEVFALKRTMPFFALILGFYMFHEKIEKKHIFATLLLVLGSFCIVYFR